MSGARPIFMKRGMVMSERIILVTGGARSGKSAFAEAYLSSCPGRKTYIATAQAQDGEMAARIAAHRRRRPSSWRTAEIPDGLPAAMPEILDQADAVLVDCLTLYFSNYLLAREGEGAEEIIDGALAEMQAVITAAEGSGKTVIFVTNELGSGLVPMNALGRLYRDMIGTINQYVAKRADAVYWTVSGIPVEIKSRMASVPQERQP